MSAPGFCSPRESGENISRVAASKAAGLSTVPGIFIDGNHREISLVENLLILKDFYRLVKRRRIIARILMHDLPSECVSFRPKGEILSIGDILSRSGTCSGSPQGSERVPGKQKEEY